MHLTHDNLLPTYVLVKGDRELVWLNLIQYPRLSQAIGLPWYFIQTAPLYRITHHQNCHRGLPLHCLLVWLSIWTFLIHRSYCRDRMLREAKSLLVNTSVQHERREHTSCTHSEIQVLTGLATSGEGPRGLFRSWACSWMLAPPSEALRPNGPMPLSSCRVGGCSNDCSWRISSHIIMIRKSH